MPFYQSIALGIVQGLTEFLPVSSSAHLILFPWMFGWEDPGLAYDVALHLGTLLGVLIYFRNDVKDLIVGGVGFLGGGRTFENKLPWFILLATLPGAVIGKIFEEQAETVFRSPLLIAGTLSVMAIFLYLADNKKISRTSYSMISFSQALIIGLSQALAIIPGVSRSGITITTALFLGLERSAAVRFSFLLSIPIIAGAGILKSSYFIHQMGSPVMWAGFISSAISGYIAIFFLMNFVKTKSFTPFVVYRLALALVILFLVFK